MKYWIENKMKMKSNVLYLNVCKLYMIYNNVKNKFVKDELNI